MVSKTAKMGEEYGKSKAYAYSLRASKNKALLSWFLQRQDDRILLSLEIKKKGQGLPAENLQSGETEQGL